MYQFYCGHEDWGEDAKHCESPHKDGEPCGKKIMKVGLPVSGRCQDCLQMKRKGYELKDRAAKKKKQKVRFDRYDISPSTNYWWKHGPYRPVPKIPRERRVLSSESLKYIHTIRQVDGELQKQKLTVVNERATEKPEQKPERKPVLASRQYPKGESTHNYPANPSLADQTHWRFDHNKARNTCHTQATLERNGNFWTSSLHCSPRPFNCGPQEKSGVTMMRRSSVAEKTKIPFKDQKHVKSRLDIVIEIKEEKRKREMERYAGLGQTLEEMKRMERQRGEERPQPIGGVERRSGAEREVLESLARTEILNRQNDWSETLFGPQNALSGSGTGTDLGIATTTKVTTAKVPSAEAAMEMGTIEADTATAETGEREVETIRLASKDTMFKYPLLNFWNDEIRLFELNPGDRQITGSFRHVHLHRCPSYTALSYTWGYPLPLRDITIDGVGTIQIQNNLWEFLRRQSSVISKPKLFWIDFMCINQSSVHEKSHQFYPTLQPTTYTRILT